ncbi:copper homeostasis protein CutC [Streptococcus himalayensis]|uniref:PF03932 family protein CutC n=1 Tax=Streptococcus himalayensis TaxID=1888195 RepID=A0A917AAE0_9STRE|nr:copper homeostasis protein CutC [Streptococcus himalayensis]GGE36653.1 copper homeostasis protein [Streptococcus himalayensis]
MIFEFCSENTTLLESALQAGARRVELCDHLAVGGTTPTREVIQDALTLAASYEASVMVMIRPRGGNFVYDKAELEEMLEDIRLSQELGAQGVVFGALTEQGQLDKPALEQLLVASTGMEIVFHMAFDHLPKDQQFTAMDWLAQHGVTRILTHGGSADTDILDNLDWLKSLIHHANGGIEILPGGGISIHNRDSISEALGVHQLHGTRIVFE